MILGLIGLGIGGVVVAALVIRLANPPAPSESPKPSTPSIVGSSSATTTPWPGGVTSSPITTAPVKEPTSPSVSETSIAPAPSPPPNRGTPAENDEDDDDDDDETDD